MGMVVWRLRAIKTFGLDEADGLLNLIWLSEKNHSQLKIGDSDGAKTVILGATHTLVDGSQHQYQTGQ